MPKDRVNPLLFLLLIAIGPVLGLTAVSLAWEPVILPRYTTYASIALYILVGGMLSAIPKAPLRHIAFLTLITLFAIQVNLLLTHHTRSDWLGAGKKVLACADANDILLGISLFPDGQQTTPRAIDMLQRNMPPNQLRMYAAHSMAGIVDLSVRCLAQDNPNAPTHVWVIIEDWIMFPQRTAFERNLRHRGLSFDYWESSNLYLYELSPIANDDTTLSHLDEGGLFPNKDKQYPRKRELLNYFIPQLPEIPSRDVVIDALRWGVPALPLSPDSNAFVIATLKAMEISPATGRLMANQAQLPPEYRNPKHILAGLAYLAEADYPQAQAQFDTANPQELDYLAQHIPGFRALTQANFQQAKTEIAADLRLNPGRIPSFFRFLAGLTPPPCGSYLIPLP